MPRLSVVCIAILVTCSAHAASFDCKLARSPREKAVCRDPKLSALDSKLADRYKQVLSTLSPQAAADVRGDQRQWLAWLDRVCPEHGKGVADQINECLSTDYNDRLGVLAPFSAGTAGARFYNRAHYGFAPGKPNDDGGPAWPGFGDSEISWPQIDNPTSAQARWNATMNAQVVAAESDRKQPFLSSDSSVSEWVTVLSADAHGIQTSVTNMINGYGAHPNTARTYMLYLFGPGREFKVTDLWKTPPNLAALRPLLERQLRLAAGKEADMYTTDRKTLDEGLDAELINPGAWTLSKKGLTVHFGQYEIGAYAIGMPAATLSWTKLRPYLVPGFDISGLPEKINDPYEWRPN